MEPSVVAAIVDSNGHIRSDVSVTFTLNGNPLPDEEQGCHSISGDWPWVCLDWYGGLEQLGMSTVTAVDANGASASMDVPVTVMGKCHVETQYVTLVLP